MKVFGLAGWSGSGKTTLLTRMLPVLKTQGCRVSTIKHAHHNFDTDHPGKDSHRHRRAGAGEVMVSSAKRWALIHELSAEEEECSLDQLIQRMSPTDLLLVEGYKASPHPKIEVHRIANGKPLLCRDDPHIVALASDREEHDPIFKGIKLPRFSLDHIEDICRFIVTFAGTYDGMRDGTATRGGRIGDGTAK